MKMELDLGTEAMTLLLAMLTAITIISTMIRCVAVSGYCACGTNA